MVWRRPLYVSTPCSLRNLLPPDLLIAFNVDPEAGSDRNGYVTSEQGKPPDFVLEIASPSTGPRDVTLKRDGYAALGIPEYRRFDDSGAGATARPWPATNWLTAPTNPSPLNVLTTGLTRATARSWTCTSDGRMADSAGTTRPPDGTYPGSGTSGTAPTPSRKPRWVLIKKPARGPKPKWTLSGTAPTPSRKAAFRLKPGPRGPKPGPGSSRRSSGDASSPERLELSTGAAGICTARRLQPRSLGAEPGTGPPGQ